MWLQDWSRVKDLDLIIVLFALHAVLEAQVTHNRKQQKEELTWPSQGLWSEWTSWSSCSSTCGDGAAFRKRRCLWATKEKCSGVQRQYKLCQSGVCPADASPFRSMQCSLYNYKSIPGTRHRYQWVPFDGAPTACDLHCLAVGHNFYYTFGRVLDGTRCGPNSDGTCINGECLTAGCDGILGSEATTDSCGKCEGQNQSCVFIQGVFREPFPSTGIFQYKNVTRIPAGATQIKVTDRSRNFLALMSSNRRYVVNGNWAVSWPGVYKVAGTEVHYNRTETSHEILEAPGPTKDDLYILVLFQERNPGIEYEFWLPKETFQSIRDGFKNKNPAYHSEIALVPWVHDPTPHSNHQPLKDAAELREDLSVSTGSCRKCMKPRGRVKRVKNYCESDFVIRARILAKRLLGQETRYDIQVMYVYKKNFPIVHREYIWVSNTCDCPELQVRQEYLLMASRHVNYEHTLNRILLSANSYVKPWSPHEDQQLRNIGRLCSASL
ncbi:ADAMTS-like protein 5 [Spea bombifrons]|uniref:ADAMTS-like protein 5 n=1 Tax=Spea bombifrons TaxID=233779 RepID=UPI00234BF16E|nr:ADAMTS-like protein 5 [Spea bombifrons]